MRGAALCLCLVALGCSPTTSLRLTITGDAADATPAALTLSIYDAHHALLNARPLGTQALPLVAVAYGLPALSEPLRLVVARAGTPRQLGAARVTILPRAETRASVALSASTPDGDGDGVPDTVDNCPTVPNPDQASGSGMAGNACGGSIVVDLAGADLFGTPPADFAGTDGGPAVASLALLAGGLGGFGDADGVGSLARFNYPNGIAVVGNMVYVMDSSSNGLRKIDPATMTVTTPKLVDGVTGMTFGGFVTPTRIAYDGSTYLYVVEEYGYCVRRVRLSDGAVFLVAGNPNMQGHADVAAGGDPTTATFSNPQGIAVDGSGKIWVADTGNNTIRLVDLAAKSVTVAAGAVGMASTVDGSGGPSGTSRFTNPVAMFASGSKIYIGDTTAIRVIDTSQAQSSTTYVTTVVQPNVLGGNLGLGVGTGANDLFTSDNDYVIRDLTPGMPPTFPIIAGTVSAGVSKDGVGAAGTFRWPQSLAGDGSGTWYIVDDAAVRRFDYATKQVSTIAGMASQSGSSDNPPVSMARPQQIVFDGNDTIWFADSQSCRIRSYTISTGAVKTLAGAGADTSTDGTGTAATFANPTGITLDGVGNLWVSDLDTNAIRKVTVPGGVVSTPVVASNGVPPAFKSPYDLAFDGNRTIFVADADNDRVRAVDTMTNAVSVFAGNGVPDEVDNAIGTSAAMDAPVGVAVDRTRHILYVSDWGGHTIRAIDLSNANHPVSTVTGSGGNSGLVNGTLALARFYGPREMAYDDARNVLYVSDAGNNAVRKIDLAAKMVSTYVGDGTQTMQLGPLPGKINSPSGLALTPGGLVIATAAENALLLAH